MNFSQLGYMHGCECYVIFTSAEAQYNKTHNVVLRPKTRCDIDIFYPSVAMPVSSLVLEPLWLDDGLRSPSIW